MTDTPKSGPDASKDSTSDRNQQTAALLRILELDKHNIAQGNFRDAEDFFTELDAEDQETGDSTSGHLDSEG
ncbi:hypothetical protein WN982_40805 [Paraburkholderia sp. IMGN_8]|uniref:hypothetical protein n=1 Tax=Paraburkholderia sp. IMGN_8 TaxID=3136564 RepID=UPI003101A4F2